MNTIFEDIWLNLDRQETVKNKIPTRFDWYKHLFYTIWNNTYYQVYQQAKSDFIN